MIAAWLAHKGTDGTHRRAEVNVLEEGDSALAVGTAADQMPMLPFRGPDLRTANCGR